MRRSERKRWVSAVGLGLLVSLGLAVCWYRFLAEQYVGVLYPIIDHLLAALSLGKWKVELVLLHLANWIPFVTLSLLTAVFRADRRKLLLGAFAGLLLIILGHIVLAVYMTYLHMQFNHSPFFAYGLIIGYSLHDLLPLALWLKMTEPFRVDKPFFNKVKQHRVHSLPN